MKTLRILLILTLAVSHFPLQGFAEEQAQAAEVPAVPSTADMEKNDGKVTLELQGVSIFDVFKILSKKSDLNIVAGKSVQGQVSIYLKEVPVREALKTILQSQGLASIEEDGIVKVMTEDEFLKKYGRPYEDTRITRSYNINHASVELLASKIAELKSPFGKIITEPRTNTLVITELPKVIEEMEKLIRESDQEQEHAVYHLNFTRAEDLEPKLKSFMEGTSGKLEIDKYSNNVIVFDIASRIKRVRALVKAFDVKTPQVLIEAKILEVQLSDAYRKGINWQLIIEKVGSFETISALAPLTVSPPTGVASLATLALGSGGDDLQTVLSLLEQIGKTNLLSSPRLTVMNNQEAKLAVATRQPFVSQTIVQTTNSTNTADNVQFIDVGVTLKVTPRISQDDFVEMKIKPEVSSSNSSLQLEGVAPGSNTTFTRTSIPIVTTQELETTVQIKSGRTLVIGGLIQDHREKSSTRVPILRSIPWIGRAFESNTEDITKTELVVFLTPVIAKPSENSPETKRFFEVDGKLKPYEEVGDYPTDFAYGILGSKRRPFWESKNGKS